MNKDIFVLTFGRFNPPTKGHEVVFDSIETAGKKYQTKNLGIFTSQTTQDAKNPLSYRDKVKFIRKAHPNVRVYENRSIKTLFDAVAWALEQDYSTVVVVLGSDRIPAFKPSITKFVQKEYPGKKVIFEQAGATRSDSSKGVAGVSGTKVRKAVKDRDFKAFADMISDSMSKAQKKQLFDMLQKKSKALSESVAFAMDIPNTFSQRIILKNPSWNDILKMMKGGSGKVRGFFNDNDIYCWDASHFIHSTAISYLRMSEKNFRIFFKFGLGNNRTIDAITTFSTSTGLAWFEPEYKNMDPDINTFNKHAKKLGWKFGNMNSPTLQYFMEQDEMILPQKSHITIHQLDNTTFDAKIDTGNNSYCAMHADNIQVSGNQKMVSFTINGKTYTAPVVEFVTIASSMGHQQNRVVVQFDVHFANQHYTDIKFSLTDRSNKEYPILLGTEFLSQTNVLIKPIAESFFSTVVAYGGSLDVYKDSNISELAKIYKEIHKERVTKNLSRDVHLRFFANENELYCWNGLAAIHDDILSALKRRSRDFDIFGSVQITPNGRIYDIQTLHMVDSLGGFPSDKTRTKLVLKRFKDIQARYGWELANGADQKIKEKTKWVGGLEEYRSLESTIRQNLYEAQVYKDSGIKIFDNLSNISSNIWYKDASGYRELRWLYLPKAKKHLLWRSTDVLHYQLLAILRDDDPKFAEGEGIIYAGTITQHPLDSEAISAVIDHAYKFANVVTYVTVPKIPTNEFGKIAKSLWLNAPMLYVKTASDGGGKSMTEKYREVAFITDKAKDIVQKTYTRVS